MHNNPDAYVRAIAAHIEGWRSATFGWQHDPDPAQAKRNKQAAVKRHAAECLRRIQAELVAYGVAPVTAPLAAACSTEQGCCQPEFCRSTGGCEKVEDREGWRPVAWMHEFTDPRTGQRAQEPRLHRPKDFELQPGDVVTPMYFRASDVPKTEQTRPFWCHEQSHDRPRCATQCAECADDGGAEGGA